MIHRSRLAADPAVCEGKVCVKGTRITIAVIRGCLADGMTIDDVLAEYESLQREDVQAALEHAAELAQGRKVPIAPAA